MEFSERGQVIGQVLKTIFRYNMLLDGARLGVAVSGGADSVALLHALHRLSKTRDWSLHVLHFNHLLRGAESDEDCRFVEDLSASLGLECLCGSADVRAAALGGNLEQTARQLRYQFFSEMRDRQKLDAVATGHTASDQAETVLMRLLRGASPDSLAGIRPVNDGWIVRPLLELTRDEVRDWLSAEGIGWREDSTNSENCYDRNKLRNEVLPLLRSEWNPKVEAALTRLAALAARDEEFWHASSEAVCREAVARNRFGVIVNVERLCREHPALQARVIKRACAEASGDSLQANPPRLTHDHVDSMLRLVAQREGDGQLSLPGLRAWRSFSQVLLHKKLTTFTRPAAVVLTAPGSASLDSSGHRLHARRAEIRIDAYNETSNWLEGGLAPGPFSLRPWRAGDRCGPAGEGEERTLHRYLQHRRIPAWDRIAWPVLEWQGQVVWARGLGVAAGWRAGAGSSGAIEIVEEPTASWR